MIYRAGMAAFIARRITVNSNIPVPEGMAEITNIVGGATTPVGWLAVKFGEFFTTAP